MVSCEHYRELVWDHLYGLLEPDEEEAFRAHLQVCPTCQEELAGAKKQQQLLARAAQSCPKVPEFTAPKDEPAPASVPGYTTVAAPAAQEAPALLPMPARRSMLRRVTPWVRAVAACLILAVWLQQLYQSNLSGYESTLAQARKKVREVDTLLAATVPQFNAGLATKDAELKKEVRQVQVLGPANYHPHHANNYLVCVQDCEGQPQSTQVLAQVIDAAAKQVLHEQTVATSKGTTEVVVPGGLKTAAREVKLVIQAQNPAAAVEESLTVSEPSYVTHLVTNKNGYQVLDNLFFRVLVLERFSLKPPEETIPLHYTLRDQQGKAVLQLRGETGPGGIGGAEFALTANLTDGLYTLEVQALDDYQAKVQPQSRKLEIFREQPTLVQFDRAQYRGGEKVQTYLNLQNRRELPKTPVTIHNLKVDGQWVGANGKAPGASLQVPLDALGNASVQFNLPNNLDKTKSLMEMELEAGKRKEKVAQNISVVPSKMSVEFFPEGGLLVAGLPNRVYYRVRTPGGESVDPMGLVIVLSKKGVPFDSFNSPWQGGQGAFTLTPEIGETYTVRLTSPEGVSEIDMPFDKFWQKTGTLLHVPGPVSLEEEPLKLVLHNNAGPRQLVLIATCRGQIVGQRSISIDDTAVTLEWPLVAGAHGVVRITLLEASGDRLVPLAERLVYRVPAGRLDLSLTHDRAQDNLGLLAGQKLGLKFKAQDERKQPAPVWFFGLVVDESVKDGLSDPGLPAHFYLMNELKAAEDLENANILLGEAPQAKQALELFLSIDGWRRFTKVQALAQFAQANKTGGKDLSEALIPAFFCKANASLPELQNQVRQKAQGFEQQLRVDVTKQQADLAEQRDVGLREVRVAAVALADFQALPAYYLRYGCGLVALFLLGIGGLFLMLGLVWALQRKMATVPFGVAMVNLAACAALFVLSGQLPIPEPSGADPFVRAPTVALPVLSEEERKLATGEKQPMAAVPQGLFASLGEEKARGPVLQPPARDNQVSAYNKKLSDAVSPGAGSFAPKKEAAKDQGQVSQNVSQLAQRFQQNQMEQEKQKVQAGPAAPTQAPSPSAKGAAGKTAADLKDAPANTLLREFAYANSPMVGHLQDPLLWAPALFAQDGKAQAPGFDLPYAGSFRVLIFAHSPTGRLGHFETTLEVPTK